MKTFLWTVYFTHLQRSQMRALQLCLFSVSFFLSFHVCFFHVVVFGRFFKASLEEPLNAAGLSVGVMTEMWSLQCGCAGLEMDRDVGRDTNTAALALMSRGLELAGAWQARTRWATAAYNSCSSVPTVAENIF